MAGLSTGHQDMPEAQVLPKAGLGEERLGQWRAGRNTELCRQLLAYPGFPPHNTPQQVFGCELSAPEAQGGNELKLILVTGGSLANERSLVTRPLRGLSEEEVLIFHLEGHSHQYTHSQPDT